MKLKLLLHRRLQERRLRVFGQHTQPLSQPSVLLLPFLYHLRNFRSRCLHARRHCRREDRCNTDRQTSASVGVVVVVVVGVVVVGVVVVGVIGVDVVVVGVVVVGVVVVGVVVVGVVVVGVVVVGVVVVGVVVVGVVVVESSLRMRWLAKAA
eukprot:TRINITY_DN7799_c0_g2_i2.p3 TRINITY_DN7799_c0_g2~~TRINITY_DN7799_c0_g2_i2.p3  ORF type:complete len:152 (-),score=3.21 TRINITY_DN7799_c0_g2_i2:120-575(-)